MRYSYILNIIHITIKLLHQQRHVNRIHVYRNKHVRKIIVSNLSRMTYHRQAIYLIRHDIYLSREDYTRSE